MNRLWICNDVWMDIFPSYDHAQLGLKMALLSPRSDALVDKHFDGKSELTIWNYANSVPFPLPDRPLPSKIHFSNLQIKYDYKNFIGSVLAITLADFKKVDGMSNEFWGWGLEDDDFYL